MKRIKMKKVLLSLIITTIIVSCSDDIENSNFNELNQKTFEQEIAFPNRNGEVSSFEMKNNKNLFYTEIDTFKVFEGDILLSKNIVSFLEKEKKDTLNLESKSQKIKSAPAVLSNRWTNSTVNFKISLSTRRDDILWAINHIRSNTNIEFTENASGNYVDFVESDGCSSYIGMTGGRQLIRLASGCGRGSIVHEICHALGVFHEQSRPDRNNHVIINWGNIESGKENNFETELAHNYGNFDFGSIMMYNSWAFNPPGSSLPTITKLDGSTFGAQRIALSATDINALRDMYIGPNMLRIKNSSYDILDIGANSNGDNVYIRRTNRSILIYKNDILFGTYSTSSNISSIDITSNGQIITNLSGYNTGTRGYSTIDISEGGGNTYCIAQKNGSSTTNLYKKNGTSWQLISSNINAKRITTDSNGKPWVLNTSSIRQFNDNGSSVSISKPVYSNSSDELFDIGSSNNEIYVSMKHKRNGTTQFLKYSSISNQLIRQPGEASYLDGQGNGVIWTN